MSRLREEIQACMRGLENGESGRFSARFAFPDDFVGFKGHFPGKPVLPGICKIQAVLAMCESHWSAPVHLNEVLVAKFVAPVGSNEELTIDCREVADDQGGTRIKASILRGEERVAQIELRVNGVVSGATG